MSTTTLSEVCHTINTDRAVARLTGSVTVPAPPRSLRLVVLLLTVLGLASCETEGAGNPERPSVETFTPDHDPDAEPTPTRIPGRDPEVSLEPDWSRTVEETGYPVMPTN